MLFPMSLSAIGSTASASRAYSQVHDASVYVSLPTAGECVVPRRESATVLVQIVDTVANSISVEKSGQRPIRSLLQEGDSISLSPGVMAVVQAIPVNSVVRYDIPNESFRAFALQQEHRKVDAFQISPGTSDAVLYLLSRSAGSLFGTDRPPSKMFTQYFGLSLYSHLAERYGVQYWKTEAFRGGLSPGNKRIVDEALYGTSEGSSSLEVLAARCRLSSRQFARAFQKSYGMPFYQLQLGLRMQRAKHLLTTTVLPLKVIAAQLGYADQATFTESFARLSGMPPGRYRRQYLDTEEPNV